MIKRVKQNAEDWTPFKSLTGMVRLILIVDWDPIGVFGHKSTLDEYDNYVSAVVDKLNEGAGVEALADCLFELERGLMGIRGSSISHRLLVAAKLRGAKVNCG